MKLNNLGKNELESLICEYVASSHQSFVVICLDID